VLAFALTLTVFPHSSAVWAAPAKRKPSGAAAKSDAPNGSQAPSAANSASVDDARDDEREVEGVEPVDVDPTKLQASDLGIVWNPHSARYLRFFRDSPVGRARLRSWLARVGRYEGLIAATLKEEGLPRDLMYLVAIESSFDPSQRSFAGAAGLWQFMPTTARAYGLRVDHWVDERLDAQRATRAAAHYLLALKSRFRNWELALAAYNAGFGVISATIARHQTNNFWALQEIENGLPLATANYVPKVLAVALADRNRTLFPFEIEREAARNSIAVDFPPQTTLREIGHAISISEAELARDNPHLLRKRVPPDVRRYPVIVPSERVDAARELARSLFQKRPAHRTHALRIGEDIADLSLAFGVAQRDLRRLNHLAHNEEAQAQTLLLLPEGAANSPREQARAPFAALPPLKTDGAEELGLVEIRPHTDLFDIASALGVRTSQLVAWNDLDPSAALWPGQVLAVMLSPSNKAAEKLRILPASAMTIFLRGSREHLEASVESRGLVRQAHRVRKGETLAKIAKRYDLSTGSLARINGIKRTSQPEVGTVLIVYAPPARKKGKAPLAAPAPHSMPVFDRGVARSDSTLADPPFALPSR
jgi:membrane-bound lytic murein transglycosylase D